jgi:antitoxin component YwqK of YwqJK toxin-antitoxin module
MSDISKLVAVEESINFIINGTETSLNAKELSIKEREVFNSKLINEAKTNHIKKINEIANNLNKSDKIEYLVAATNSMPDFETQIGTLIFSNNGMRYLIKAAIKNVVSDKDIDAILESDKNGDAIGKLVRIALKLRDTNESNEVITETNTKEVEESTESPNV